ncbi:MAG: hypothetical protein MUC36_12685 [Planctomycetes bacterium]|jgi:hypothetical protein|nr:hypothetical protein [Planctomycetota bacterium]
MPQPRQVLLRSTPFWLGAVPLLVLACTDAAAGRPAAQDPTPAPAAKAPAAPRAEPKVTELTAQWENVRAFAAIGELGFVVANDVLYRIDQQGRYTELGSGWNPAAMIACKGWLYVFERARGSLHRVDPKTGKSVELPGNWPQVQAATTIADAIYVVCQTRIYRVEV